MTHFNFSVLDLYDAGMERCKTAMDECRVSCEDVMCDLQWLVSNFISMDSKKFGFWNSDYIINTNLKSNKIDFSWNQMKSIFREICRYRDINFWFLINFYCKSDAIIDISKFHFLDAIGIKLETNHFILTDWTCFEGKHLSWFHFINTLCCSKEIWFNLRLSV